MRRRALCSLAMAAIAACSSDPLRPPEIPVVEQYTSTAVAEDRLAPGKDIPAQWWTLFRSPTLDGLVRRALDNSPTLARAQARLRQAQEDLSARSGATQCPKVDAKLSANRVDVNPQSLGVPALPVPMPLDLYLASISVSYTFDFAGGTRRELEGLRAEVDHQRLRARSGTPDAGRQRRDHGDPRSVAARADRARARRSFRCRRASWRLPSGWKRSAAWPVADVVAQQRELAQTRAALPDLRRDLERMRHRLAVYVGLPPSAPGLPEFRMAELQLPAELPLSLPSQLARQRPDIRAAEALLARAGAQVGVATANLYPQLTLSAQLGSLSTKPGDLFEGGNGFYLLGASLFYPCSAAVSCRPGVARPWRPTSRPAPPTRRRCCRASRMWRTCCARSKPMPQGSGSAPTRRIGLCATATSPRERLAAGGVSEAAMLEATRHHRRAMLEKTQAAADRYADSAALLQALGGGWWQLMFL